MIKILKIADSLPNKISYYHLLLLLASMPFDQFYSHLILISYTIHTLIHLRRERLKALIHPNILLLQSVFFITVFSTIYSTNKPDAFGEWGEHIPIFLFPVVFCLNPLDLWKYRQQLLLGFALVCTATVLYLYADALRTIGHYHQPLSTLFSANFTNHNFAQPIDMHATFFSMQLVVALSVFTASMVNQPKASARVFYLVCCSILVAGLIQLSSKAAFFILLILLNAAIPWFLLSGKIRIRYTLASVTISVVAGVLLLNSFTFRERLITELKDDMARPANTGIHDGRLARWEVTAGLIKNKPLVGYGAGTEIGLLQDGFYKHKLYDSYLNRLNTHSEYLSMALKSGIIGLLLYLGTLIFGFKVAARRRDLVFVAFTITIAVVSFSENLLDVDKGAFFYGLFFTFFWFSFKKSKSSRQHAPKQADTAAATPEIVTTEFQLVNNQTFIKAI